jgi:hypothetical protein
VDGGLRLSEQAAILRHIFIMLLKSFAEKVSSLGIGDKIEIVGWRRIERRA